MDPEALTRALEELLASSPGAIVVEEGQVLFDLARARYSISGEGGKCLLHIWSDDRNVVRRVLELDTRKESLLLRVQRFGQAKALRMEIAGKRDQRTPAARKAAREQYLKTLERVLARNFGDCRLDQLTSAMDLERSFGPTYARGLLRKGRSAFAILGVNAGEQQSSIDNALTFALLWLDRCREKEAGTSVVEGVRLFVPAGSAEVLCARIAWLNPAIAKYEVYELDERIETVKQLDPADHGNVATRLVRAPDERLLRDRFRPACERVLAVVPEAETVCLATHELAFRLNGLEFARARVSSTPGSLDRNDEIIFGAGAHERVLDDDNEILFRELMGRVRQSRHAAGAANDPLWRMQGERWLESVVKAKVTVLLPQLDQRFVYSQVPAFSAADRAMIDVLGCTRDGRLVVIELKADEDIHLPLQGLDYWARVRWHQQRDEFRRFGYFPREANSPLASADPILLLVAPGLHVHPTIDTVLRYFSPAIEWEVIGIAEQWREQLRVLFRKRPKLQAHA
jgi:hypothetical protein